MITIKIRLLLAVGLASSATFATGAEQVTAGSERLQDGKRNYDAICAQCHETGELEAPITGKAEDWADRSHLWEAVLFEHADKGYINMPARGASDYATEYDVETAAEYMLTITHPELPRD
jgi:cytochrome c5